ncbi:MAG: hypothetical protein GY838_04755 [bacterium]|nr:hypothetical protein [bacterium]
MLVIRRLLLPILLATTVLAVPATAGELGESLDLRGFVSQGYLNTTGNEYLIPRSLEGTAELFEAGIALTASPRDGLRVGMQFLARDFGDQGNGTVALDWAYLDFRWYDQLGLRAGKVKLPFGLYNEQRDLDILRTGVFLPQSVYPEYLRDFALAYEGLGAYGNLVSGAGSLDYHVFGGTLNVPDAGAGYWKDNFEQGAVTNQPAIARQVEAERGLTPGSATATFANIVDPTITFPWIAGGALVWEPPLNGLRLGASLLTGRFLYEAEARYDVDIAPDMAGDPLGYASHTWTVNEDANMNHLTVLSAEFTWRDLLLATEYYDERIADSTPAGWYALADWRAHDRWALALTWSAYWHDRHNRDGSDFRTVGLPEYYGWQKVLTGAVRCDLNENWLLKVEYHFIDGVAQARLDSWQEEFAQPAARHWGMLTARTTVYF